MTSLEKFVETIQLARVSLNADYQAYRIDGNSPDPDMRKKAGLGSCNCCDYFLISKDGVIILIEETQLIYQIKNLQEEYCYFKPAEHKEFTNKCIREENRLKVYGSMLVLCRMSAKYKDVQKLLQRNKYQFWLVVSGKDSPKNSRVFRNLRKPLLFDLRGVLTKEVVDDFKILSVSQFCTLYTQYATTP